MLFQYLSSILILSVFKHFTTLNDNAGYVIIHNYFVVVLHIYCSTSRNISLLRAIHKFHESFIDIFQSNFQLNFRRE